VIAFNSAMQPNFNFYSDGSNPPTTLLGNFRNDDGNAYLSGMFPIRKNDYWKITGDANVFFWLPFGTGGCVKQ
jgi:hypothetical protein